MSASHDGELQAKSKACKAGYSQQTEAEHEGRKGESVAVSAETRWPIVNMYSGVWLETCLYQNAEMSLNEASAQDH